MPAHVVSVALPVASSAAEKFEAFYRAERDAVYAYALTILCEQAAAEDAVATSFEKLYRRRALIRWGGGSERRLLFKVVRNTALDELRRRGRQALPSDEIPDMAGPEADLGDVLARRQMISRALLTLKALDRELVVLRYWADLESAEIARLLGLTQTNVTTRLNRTLRQLRKELDHEHETA